MQLRIRYLLPVVTVLVACALATRAHLELRPVAREAAVRISGHFPRDGEYPGRKLPGGAALRFWGSWAGSDTNEGTLRLGPFRAPSVLHFAIGGYPEIRGNALYLERTDTRARLPIRHENVGERWRVADVTLPADWVGRPVDLVAVDHATVLGGWLAVSEPLRGGLGEGNANLYRTVACWLANGLILASLWLAALRVLIRRGWTSPSWTPLVAAGVVAAGGYLLFWLYFAAPILGKLGSVGLVLAGVVLASRRRVGPADAWRDARAVAVLLVSVGAFYLAVLHLFPSSRDFYGLAQNRFREALPGDNGMPNDVTMAVYAGRTLRPAGADWLTSDRPPLQTGWQLITLPFTRLLRFDGRTSTATSAFWLQLLWIPAAYGLLRTLGLSRRRSSAWVVLLALTGFFVQNTVFTWPKLSSGAFGCGAFALWVCPGTGRRRRADYVLGAALAGLAWMSHGGIAFSFIALAPWIVWRIMRGEFRGWLLATGVFLLFALPWFGFQKLYNPPGDRLIKWHLAGHPAKDSVGAWKTIRDAYHRTPWSQLVAARVDNFRIQEGDDWRAVFHFTPAGGRARRDDEFFHSARALTWWVLGLPALVLALARAESRRRIRAAWRAHAGLPVWTLATVVVWCLLMFAPYSAVIHQGSYAVMIAAFVVLSAWCDLAGAGLIYPIAILQTATFVTTWAWANPTIHGRPEGWPWLALAALGLLAVFGANLWWVTPRTGSRPVGRDATPSATAATTE